MRTFKEYLIEFTDRGDIALQQQHAGTLQQGGEEQKGQDKTFAKTPVIGDTIQNNSGSFVVVKNNMGVLSVQSTKGGKVTVVPQQAKFTFAGETQNGKNLFNVGQ